MSSQKMFKTISQEMVDKFKIKFVREYFFLDESGSKVKMIETKIDPLKDDKRFKVMDENREWFNLRNNKSFFVNLHVEFLNTNKLFTGKEQVCNENAVLGLGIVWKSFESKVKYSKRICHFSAKTEKIEVDLEGIEIKNANSDIEFQWIIYVVDGGTNTTKAPYAVDRGIILGSDLAWNIIVSGNGSIFPVYMYSKTGDPLWQVSVDFDDWSVDEFTHENTYIYLNPAHELYSLIDLESEFFNENFLKEVFSSALCILISNIIEVAKDNGQYEQLFQDSKEKPGSILSAIKYFRDVHNIIIDNGISELEKSIKNFFDKGGKICK